MSFKATVCPSCGKHIQIPTDVPAPACPYCAQVLQGVAAPAATVSTLLGLARTALTAGNSAEALEYFNRVLESDPANSEAWMGKGKAAGWQSSVVHIRLPEMLIAFNHGIATAAEASKNTVIQQAVDDANHLVVTLHGMARKHMLEYVALKNSWPEYIGQSGQLINALSDVKKWVPTDPNTLNNIVSLCKDNIEGVSYTDRFDNNSSKALTLTDEYEGTLRTIMDSAVKDLKALDPSYIPPLIEKKKADACFVVTATMGDNNHPTVTLMRRFRDECLLERSWGVRFVDWYYRHGPVAAKFITHSPIKRRISYLLIVRPAAWLAQRLL